MAYCTQSELLHLVSQEELAELTTEAGEVPDSQMVAQAIARAEDEINAYLGVRYQIPFNPVPAKIRGLAADLALYGLYSRRSVVPAVRRQRYEDALSFLKQVAAGQVVLEGLEGAVSGKGAEPAEMTSAARLFSRDQLGDW